MNSGDTTLGGGDKAFPETTLGFAGGLRNPATADYTRSLETLCSRYWKPVYSYIRIAWAKSNEDAKDLTQSFFMRALEKDFFDGYDPEKGSFRTYLRTCLDRFVLNEKKAAVRVKRWPGAPPLPLDFESAEGELSRQDPPDPASMDQYFHDEWVRSLFSLSVERLREECEKRGKDLPYRLFERYELDRDPDEKLTYERLAEEFAIPATQVTNFLALARREFRRIVLEKLREITATDHEFREEARSLLGVSE